MKNNRQDFGTIILKGKAYFSRSAYAVVTTRNDAWQRPFIWDVQTFFGNDGRKTRAEAMRFARDRRQGKPLGKYRSTYVPSNFPRVDLPREEFIVVPRGA